MKHIRWQGVVAFICVIGVFSLLWFFFVDLWVERAIENYGTRAVGAKVELAQADLSLFPAGLELDGLQVTDPDEPMQNIVEIARIRLSLDGLNLLRRKVIVQEMALDGVRMKTARKTSGALHEKKEPAEKGAVEKKKGGEICRQMQIPSFEKPDVKKILEQEDLLSVKLAQALKADAESAKATWQTRLKELPDQEKLRGYRTRIDEVRTGAKGGLTGALGSAADLVAIQKDLERDTENIRLAHREATDQVTGFKARLEAASQAPEEDFNRLKDKYAPGAQGLGNWSKLILGSRVCAWMEQAVAWYGKIKPLLARSKGEPGAEERPAAVKPLRGRGVDVRFKESPPLPDFLIRKMQASVQLEGGEIRGRILNLTPDQDILGLPTTLDFAGKDLKGLRALTAAGEFNHVNPAKARDTLNVTAKGWAMRDLPLVQNPEWPLKLDKGLADVDLQAALASDVLNGSLGMKFGSTSFSSGTRDPAGPGLKAVSSALSAVSGFSLKAQFTGTFEDYDIRLSSDLDRMLGESLGKVLEKEAAGFREELRKAVAQRAEGPLGDAGGGVSALQDVVKELADRLNLGAAISKTGEGKGAEKGLNLPFKVR